jgi:hypothetical protein
MAALSSVPVMGEPREELAQANSTNLIEFPIRVRPLQQREPLFRRCT